MSSSIVVLLNYYYSTSHGLNFSLEKQVVTPFVLNPPFTLLIILKYRKVEGLSIKEKKKELIITDNSVAIARKRGWVEVKEGIGEINDDGK